MSLFRNFIKDVGEAALSTDYLRDYKHASRTFVADNQALAPRLKFLYHVDFELNPAVPAIRQLYPRADQTRIGLLVKTCQLPSFEIQTEELRQYNRTRYIQTGIKYGPVQITLHDDGSDIIRNLWRQYYTYNFGDTLNSSADGRNIYANEIGERSWGFSGDPFGSQAAITPGVKLPFFSAITVYGLNQKSNIAYRLINPVIKSWSHDTYDYSDDAGTMEHQITVEYEYVKYIGGKPNGGEGAVGSFADPSVYDTAPSPLGQAGSTTSIFGPGGLVNSGEQIFDDISEGNFLGAGLKAFRLGKNLKGKNIKDALKSEAVAGINKALTGAVTSSGFKDLIIPKKKK